MKKTQQHPPKDRTINLPSKWSDISLGQYFDYRNAVTDHARIMAITGLPDATVRTIPLDQYTTILQTFEDVMGMDNPDADFQTQVRLNGKPYGFIPELKRISLGEYLDLVTYHEENQGGIQKNMLKVFGTLYRPVVQSLGGRYQIADYDPTIRDGYIDDIRSMPMHIVQGAMVFFCVLLSELLTSSPEYSPPAIRKMMNLPNPEPSA